jgi:hypothetical protein
VADRRAHIAIEPDTGIITDCGLNKTSGEHSADAQGGHTGESLGLKGATWAPLRNIPHVNNRIIRNLGNHRPLGRRPQRLRRIPNDTHEPVVQEAPR